MPSRGGKKKQVGSKKQGGNIMQGGSNNPPAGGQENTNTNGNNVGHDSQVSQPASNLNLDPALIQQQQSTVRTSI